MTPEYATERSGPGTVLRHLQACDAAFHPPLSDRVDLAAYADKLAEHALRMEAWVDDELVGLVAVYCNAPDRGTAFVSNVSVLPSYTGQGFARKLMCNAIDRVRALSFASLSLEVDHRAASTMRLYISLGFQAAAGTDAATQRMTLPLR